MLSLNNRSRRPMLRDRKVVDHLETEPPKAEKPGTVFTCKASLRRRLGKVT